MDISPDNHSQKFYAFTWQSSVTQLDFIHLRGIAKRIYKAIQ